MSRDIYSVLVFADVLLDFDLPLAMVISHVVGHHYECGD